MNVKLGDWVDHLRAIAAPAMRDPYQPRTETERCLSEVVSPVFENCPAVTIANLSADEALWRAAVDARVNIADVLPATRQEPMFDQGLFRAIEVWTESELSGLHALWRIARLHTREDLFDWCSRLREWHIEFTQPDNATNRPWALHVFLLQGSPESEHYAQTLLHNSIATEGRPTPLCARILMDAAAEIELAYSKK